MIYRSKGGLIATYGFDGYQYQSLEDACQQMEIPIEGSLHSAATDAPMTAKLLLKLAEIAERDLPASCS